MGPRPKLKIGIRKNRPGLRQKKDFEKRAGPRPKKKNGPRTKTKRFEIEKRDRGKTKFF